MNLTPVEKMHDEDVRLAEALQSWRQGVLPSARHLDVLAKRKRMVEMMELAADIVRTHDLVGFQFSQGSDSEANKTFELKTLAPRKSRRGKPVVVQAGYHTLQEIKDSASVKDPEHLAQQLDLWWRQAASLGFHNVHPRFWEITQERTFTETDLEVLKDAALGPAVKAMLREERAQVSPVVASEDHRTRRRRPT